MYPRMPLSATARRCGTSHRSVRAPCWEGTASSAVAAYVGTGVQMGDNCKLQNYALVYEPAVLEEGVFVGPAVVLTNDHYPRSITPAGQPKHGHDWEPVG